MIAAQSEMLTTKLTKDTKEEFAATRCHSIRSDDIMLRQKDSTLFFVNLVTFVVNSSWYTARFESASTIWSGIGN
jgi:hypothetical protein